MTASYDFRGKTVLVTGGSSGIGRATAIAFSQAGANVVIANRDRKAADAVAGTLAGPALTVSMDVTQRRSVEEGVAGAVARFGGIDVLVASAGISTITAALEIDDAEWDNVLAVNARGIYLTNQVVCRHFLATGRKGAVVNIASFAAKVGLPLLAHYSASKFAVLGWTQALAREMGPHGIRVNAICPGFVRTPMQEREVVWEGDLRGMTPEQVLAEYVALAPLGRLEEPEDVAAAALFLASDGAGFITGQGINTGGGVRLD